MGGGSDHLEALATHQIVFQGVGELVLELDLGEGRGEGYKRVTWSDKGLVG